MSTLGTNRLELVDGSFAVDVADINNPDSINYEAPFAGAIERNQSKKNSDKYSLYDANGKGDGTSIEDAAISSYLLANNNVLVIPRGTWKISTSLTVDALVIEDGGVITSSSAVTINAGSVFAPAKKCFSGSVSVSSPQNGLAEWFGAVGDGATDDRAAILKVISGFSGWAMMAKVYAVSAKIDVNKNFRVLGKGSDVSVIRVTALNSDGLVVYGLNSGTLGDAGSSYKLTGFSIECTATGTPSSGIGLKILWSSYGSVSHIKVKNFYCSYYLGTALCVDFRDIASFYAYNFGFQVDSASLDFIVDGIVIDGQTGPASGVRRTNVGVYIYGVGTEGFSFAGVRCTFCLNRGLLIDSSSSGKRQCPSFGKFTNCYFDTAGSYSLINIGREITFNSCWFSSSASDAGLSIGTTHGLMFSLCQFINNATHGCILSASASFTVFNACQFSSNAAVTSGNSGLSVGAGCNNFTVTNCLMDNSSLSSSQAYGVYVAPGSSTNYIIANNQMYGNLLGGVSDGGTGAQKVVQNNFT